MPCVAVDHVDVLIVGAGLSGIGAGHQIREHFPRKTYAILEQRQEIGGTWSLFKYPGIRSDSDMHTLGYRWRPWVEEKAIADGPSILKYVEDTAREGDVEKHIRFGKKVVSASWSTPDSRWTVDVEDVATGEITQMTCGFYFCCSGYYNYEEGYTPQWAGVEDFEGTVVHPQFWPEDLDYTGKKVVVIGSGATAVTLVPAMAAAGAAHVTMLQRSPTYIVPLPEKDKLANTLRRFLPSKWAYAITRYKNVVMVTISFQLSRRRPEVMKRLIRKMQLTVMPADYAFEPHLSPSYNPWDQRLCVVPDGDLFIAMKRGDASIVTDEIETFTKTGVKLVSGEELDADVIVTATGLNLLAFGGVKLTVDGKPVNLPDHMAYKAIMLSDVPNFAYGIGYTNASWTLKIDLTYDYVWRLLKHMDATGTTWCAPRLRDTSIERSPLMDFSSGYVQRSIDQFPRAGSKAPWKTRMNYFYDRLALGKGNVDDGTMEFGRGAAAPAERVTAAAS
ncbi:MAG: NAD(P)/FAD-dependent oxidoreductase [Frankiaceae bacterium]|nr:NAD(P)/FAD-dependent oxidoreductase [Frankiaceae bacterium]MBV9869460.1 NAD(P)/FAD-dependent oxidoreductase [Frankiaceae bacterium]